MEEVKKTFSAIAGHYDLYRRKLIPCFDDFYRAAVEMMPFKADQDFTVLDLGAGTGLLSGFIRERFPAARITLIDFSEEMLAKARERFGDDPRVRYQVADYVGVDWGGAWDAVVSSLSIHHLDDDGKKSIYRKVFDGLKRGGVFLNAEFVRASSSAVQERYWSLWIKKKQEAGLSEEEIRQSLKRTEIDILAPVEDQLAWLREAGFEEVECHYRQYLFAVFGGKKPV
ncbi:MAG: methyltransferase domain-containing protein [bacterium]